jgi:hypothetical protein
MWVMRRRTCSGCLAAVLVLAACGADTDSEHPTTDLAELTAPNDMGTGVDAGNTFGTATPLAVLSGTGRLGADYGSGPDDHDFYAISLTAGQTLSVTLTPPATKSFLLKIHDPTGLVVARSHAEIGIPSSITTPITQDGIYRVHVKRVDLAGRYALSISISEAAWASAYGSMLEAGNNSAIGNDSSYLARPTRDGGILFAGSTAGLNSGNAMDAWLTKLDAFGGPLWSKTYGPSPASADARYVGQAVVEAVDGYALLAMTSEGGSAVIRLNSDLTVQWHNTYDGRALNHIATTSDGGFILSGLSRAPEAPNTEVDASIVKLTSSGAMEWSGSYGGPGYDDAQYIQATPDGGYLFVGATGVPRATWLVKLASNGAIEWQRRYDAIVGGRHFHETTDGGYVIVGEGLAGAKLTATGDVVWAKRYATATESPQSARYSFHQMADGGLVLMGYDRGENATNGNGNLYVMNLDGSGAILWQRHYDVGRMIQDPSILMMKDGGFLVQSWVEDPSWVLGSYSVVLLRLPMDGMLPPISEETGFTVEEIPCAAIESSGSRVAASSVVTPRDTVVGDSHLARRDLVQNPPSVGWSIATWSFPL